MANVYSEVLAHDIALRRAHAIHLERRALFNYGPPPYAHALTLGHPETGREWVLQISAHLPPSGIDAIDLLLHETKRTNDPETLAFGLALIEAYGEVVAGELALSRGREVPVGRLDSEGEDACELPHDGRLPTARDFDDKPQPSLRPCSQARCPWHDGDCDGDAYADCDSEDAP